MTSIAEKQRAKEILEEMQEDETMSYRYKINSKLDPSNNILTIILYDSFANKTSLIKKELNGRSRMAVEKELYKVLRVENFVLEEGIKGIKNALTEIGLWREGNFNFYTDNLKMVA